MSSRLIGLPPSMTLATTMTTRADDDADERLPDPSATSSSDRRWRRWVTGAQVGDEA